MTTEVRTVRFEDIKPDPDDVLILGFNGWLGTLGLTVKYALQDALSDGAPVAATVYTDDWSGGIRAARGVVKQVTDTEIVFSDGHVAPSIDIVGVQF